MLELLSWLEGSALGETLRSLGVWTYGFLNLGHVLGVGLLIGSVVLLDLRLVGAWRSVELSSIARPTVPLAAAGFVLALGTGICMISVNASEYYGNPFLLLKFPAIGLALLNALIVARLPAWRAIHVRPLQLRERRQLAIGGAVSLVCWLTAVAGGRMIGYW
jgi:hypothetical protein